MRDLYQCAMGNVLFNKYLFALLISLRCLLWALLCLKYAYTMLALCFHAYRRPIYLSWHLQNDLWKLFNDRDIKCFTVCKWLSLGVSVYCDGANYFGCTANSTFLSVRKLGAYPSDSFLWSSSSWTDSITNSSGWVGRSDIFNPSGCHARPLLSSSPICFGWFFIDFTSQNNKLCRGSEILMLEEFSL